MPKARIQMVKLTADNDLEATVAIIEGPSGPYIQLQGVNCALEGEAPGEYHMVAPQTTKEDS